MVNKGLTRGRSCWRLSLTVLSGAERREAARGQETSAPNKKPGLSTGLFVSIPGIGILSGGFVRHGSVVAVGFDIGLIGFAVSFGRFGLGAAARALGELAFDFLDRFGLRRMLDDGDFARQPIERRFIELAFAVGLLGLRSER